MSSSPDRSTIHKQLRLWLLPLIAGLFLIAALTLLFTLQNREQKFKTAERDDALWAAYQLDRENLRFNSLLNQHRINPDKVHWQEVELRFEILYSRLNLLQQGQFARVFGAENYSSERTQQAIQLIETMDDYFIQQQAQTPEGMMQLLTLSQQLQQLTDPLVTHMKGTSTRLTTEHRQQLQQLYQYLGGLVLLLTLTMSLIILLLIRKMLEARKAQQQAQFMAKELKKTAQLAEQASLAKSNFLATMSHEIRTPMNGVLGVTDLLRETPLTREQHKYTDAIYNSADALLKLLNDLLDISRLEAGKLLLHPSEVQLGQLLQEIMDFFAASLGEKPVVVSWTLDPQANNTYQMDAGRLRQVLLNLLGNALKFTEQGRVELLVTQQPQGLRFEVHDTGPGIKPEAQQQLFEMFTQADSSISRRYGGAGLGLSICKHIVEQMQGEIGVSSQPGVGSCFYFTLPLQPLATA
ncbi:MAG: hypothetical protein IBX50_12870 [Marinospirillum sp.]|uniref:sensor histidine kinase n=1 Tax=Marinospirillum sp. TaxID=2183934 RepID=UPI001A05E5F3|nr:ATP-binding protein [Marinospirillum sp.]MBE0507585.1 hypothetical protein [Marinospirillum sp.]